MDAETTLHFHIETCILNAMKLHCQRDRIGLDMTVLHVPDIKNNNTEIVSPFF